DHALFDRLGTLRVEQCHRLHFFQMVTEKLAKALMTSPSAIDPPKNIHAALVRMLQVIKRRPEIRSQLGFTSIFAFNSYIDSLLDIANRVQALAPAIAG